MASSEEEFDLFWQHYPRRIAKGAARKAFAIAIRKTTLETMLKALEAYRRHKKPEIDFCHASTWLTSERWLDEWEPPETIKPAASELLMRKVRDLDELKRALTARHGGIPANLAPEINRAKTLADVSEFLRNTLVPNISNVTPIKKGAA